MRLKTSSLAGFVLPLLILFAGCSREVKVPESYTGWNSRCGSFALDYPEDWNAEGSGNKATGLAYAEFSNGGVFIRVDASLADSLKGDILGMGAGLSPGGNVGGGGGNSTLDKAGVGGFGRVGESSVPDELKPEALVHEHWLKHYKKEYGSFKESEGETIRIPLGSTRYTKFSAKVNGFMSVKGIRATTMTKQRGITFFAYCPTNQWDSFEPVFMKMLNSMKLGVENTGF